MLATGKVDEKALVKEAAARPSLVGQDLATLVSTGDRYAWKKGVWELGSGFAAPAVDGPLVAAFDFGIKVNILRNLASLGCRVVVVPAGSTAKDVRALGVDGVFLSNGPGDPDAVDGAIKVVGELIKELPTFGICLGHQILGLAVGAKTYKMKFGHHGGNQPVIDVDTGVVEITSQNHGFAVDPDTLAGRRAGHPAQPERQDRRRVSSTPSCRCSRCSTIPKRRRGLTTRIRCSRSSTSR